MLHGRGRRLNLSSQVCPATGGGGRVVGVVNPFGIIH